MKYITEILKPARYSGGEFGSADCSKPHELKFAMCFPDVYEVGMSNLGTRILYYMLNGMENVVCERAFTPWVDKASQMRREGEPLKSLESGTNLKDFDFLGFSFQYELSGSNFLLMLDLAQIPLKSSQRGEGFPLIIAGGPCTVNFRPFEQMCDIIVVGEGETPLKKIALLFLDRGQKTRHEFLTEVALVPGVFVPGISKTVVRSFEPDLDEAFFPDKAVVPSIEIVHDRAVVELFRGCLNGCRFCQAGFIYRPVRERSVNKLVNLCNGLISNTGYDELSLNSLSTGDFSGLKELIGQLRPLVKGGNVNFSLPSLRLSSFDPQFADTSRKSSLTFAPEAGTQRLRDVINKNITDEDISTALTDAFKSGYSTVKLYFMLGLPTETDKDIEGIAEMAGKAGELFHKYRTNRKDLRINISVATFIPKPHTPFQWEAFASRESVAGKQQLLREKLKRFKNVSLSWHSYDESLIEAVFARGDERLGEVLIKAYENGALFDGWTEHFNFSAYEKAFADCGIGFDEYTCKRDTGKPLPWDIIDNVVSKEFLLSELNKAYGFKTTPSCKECCNGCGAKGGSYDSCR